MVWTWSLVYAVVSRGYPAVCRPPMGGIMWAEGPYGFDISEGAIGAEYPEYPTNWMGNRRADVSYELDTRR